jgi:hypothetical protein
MFCGPSWPFTCRPSALGMVGARSLGYALVNMYAIVSTTSACSLPFAQAPGSVEPAPS